MGWIRTFKSVFKTVRTSLSKIPAALKKKAIRSKPVRAILVSQLGRALTSLFELHILALASVALKVGASTALAACTQNPPFYVDTGVEWTIDIFVPVFFSLQCHAAFQQLVTWTFERPLYSLARRIQYMRADDPYQFYRIKYLILVPLLAYAWILLWLVPLSREFLHICIGQTLIINVLTDYWPLRHELDFCPQWDAPPSKITRLVQHPTINNNEDGEWSPNQIQIQSSPHFEMRTPPNPFAQLVTSSQKKEI